MTTLTTATLPVDPDGENANRAGWARTAVDAFTRETFGNRTTADLEPGDVQAALGDLFGNIAHLVDRLRVEGKLPEADADLDTPTILAGYVERGQRYYADETAAAPCEGAHDSGDNPVDESGEATCQDCGTRVNAVPDLG